MFKKILVPLDGSSLAQSVLPYVEETAWKFGSKVILLQVVSPINELIVVEFMPEFQAANRKMLMEQASQYLSGVRGELRARNIEADILVVEGDAPTMILAVAEREGVDLIAMCNHGRTGFSRWAYGNVADKVLRQAPCHVLMVRAT